MQWRDDSTLRARRAQPLRSAWSLWAAAFVQRLRELGWIEGRTIAIEFEQLILQNEGWERDLSVAEPKELSF